MRMAGQIKTYGSWGVTSLLQTYVHIDRRYSGVYALHNVFFVYFIEIM